MDKKTFAIGILSITAVILFVALLLTHAWIPAAYAGEISAVSGDFTITVGRVTRDTELLYVVDNTTQRMCVYGLNRRSGKVALLQKMPIAPAQLGSE